VTLLKAMLTPVSAVTSSRSLLKIAVLANNAKGEITNKAVITKIESILITLPHLRFMGISNFF
jgi:long-subunit fatty acid transport protein